MKKLIAATSILGLLLGATPAFGQEFFSPVSFDVGRGGQNLGHRCR